jgi:hypothetical protein
MIEDRKSHFQTMNKMRKQTSKIDVSDSVKFSKRQSDLNSNNTYKNSYGHNILKNKDEPEPEYKQGIYVK